MKTLSRVLAVAAVVAVFTLGQPVGFAFPPQWPGTGVATRILESSKFMASEKFLTSVGKDLRTARTREQVIAQATKARQVSTESIAATHRTKDLRNAGQKVFEIAPLK